MEPAHQGRAIPRLCGRHLHPRRARPRTLSGLDRRHLPVHLPRVGRSPREVGRRWVHDDLCAHARRPAAQKIGNTKRYYLRDLHGDLVGLSDTNGALQGTGLYDPWGELLSATGDMAVVPTNGAFRFQSDLTDAATGQVDMLARLYEPMLGRFSSHDSLLGDPRAPSSLNQYVYGLDSPLTMSDPTGMGACTMAGDCATETNDGRRLTHGGNPGAEDYDESVQGVTSSVQPGTGPSGQPLLLPWHL